MGVILRRENFIRPSLILRPFRGQNGHARFLAITTPWAEFKKLSESDAERAAAIIDCWRLLAQTPLAVKNAYLTLGSGSNELTSAKELDHVAVTA
jgi:hypothetical protein